MESITKLEQVNEVKYLAQENTYRYRIIMNFLFSKYEQAEYWLYKEEIINEVKQTLSDYTEQECDRDLEFLLNNGSLTKLQDTQNINTINDFKFHNFRYQITDKAIIIERMLIELDELEIKVAMLEPRLFEKISGSIKRLTNVYNLDDTKIYNIWTDLIMYFKSLNEHYKDFLKKFHEAKTEELLQSEAFLEFKSSVINYINDFINSYIKNSTTIIGYLNEIDDGKINYLMNALISYQKKAPKVKMDFDYEKLRKVNYGKWQSVRKWFVASGNQSEGERLLAATQRVIQKIYKYSNSLIELHGNMINRKEEYKHVCKLFDNMNDVRDAHKLSNTIFGVKVANHFKFSSLLDTDSLVKSYDVLPLEITVTSISKEYKTRSKNSQIIDKSVDKENLLREIRLKEKQQKEKIKNLIKSGKITLENEINLDIDERRYVLSLIEKYNSKINKEPEFGFNYYITNESKDRCKIISPDGVFELNARTIILEVGDFNE